MNIKQLKLFSYIFLLLGAGLILLNLLSPQTSFSLNGLYYLFLGLGYLMAERISKKTWLQFLLFLPVLLGFVLIILQDLGKLPLTIDLEATTLCIYACLMAVICEKARGKKDDKKG
jgi:membrane protein implicated in regulation of membrane protease activity